MQIVNITSVLVCRSVSRNQYKVFCYQLSTLLLCPVIICKIRVHCHDVRNTAPSRCISVNCVDFPLNVITSNAHKTVVSYKTVESFCSDAVLQNANVVFSPACKTLCFKKHHDVSSIKYFTYHNYQHYQHHHHHHHHHYHYHHYYH